MACSVLAVAIAVAEAVITTVAVAVEVAVVVAAVVALLVAVAISVLVAAAVPYGRDLDTGISRDVRVSTGSRTGVRVHRLANMDRYLPCASIGKWKCEWKSSMTTMKGNLIPSGRK